MNDLAKSAQLLDEKQYWQIVADSLTNTDNQDDQEQYLVEHLQQLSPTEIIGFRLRTDKLLYDTYNDRMWCAGYILNGGCSDDCFEYFRNWVISRGKDAYYRAKENPDTLMEQLDDELEFYEFESFWYVALAAFEAKTGQELYAYIDNDHFKFSESHYPRNVEFTWREEEPETMRAICPQLFDAVWE